MKIVRPYAKILSCSAPVVPEDLNSTLRPIEWAARVSHRSEDSAGPGTTKRFIEAVVLQHGDWSVVEHVSVTVDALVDCGITHEWVRHRLFSYTQESTHFVNYEKKMPPSFIYPKPEVECAWCLKGDEVRSHSLFEASWLTTRRSACAAWSHDARLHNICAYDIDWLKGIARAEVAYAHLIYKGWRPQEARSVFPNALASRLIVTGNLRSWRQFFLMRTTAEAHPQMRQVTIPLLADFKKAFPILFDDIEPNAKQSESIRKGR